MTADEIKVIYNIFKSYQAIVDKLLKLAKNHGSDSVKIAEVNSLEAEKKLMELNMYEQLSPGKRGRPHGTIKKEPDKAGVPYCIQAVRETIRRFPNKDHWNDIVEACNGKSEETMIDDMAYFFGFWTKISDSKTNLAWILDWYKNNYLPPNVSRLGDARPEHTYVSNGKRNQPVPTTFKSKEEPLTNEDSARIAAITGNKRGFGGLKENA